MENKCIGCGAILQGIDEQKAGYVPIKLLDKEGTYCLRCFRLRNYNESKEVLHEDYLKIISSISKEDALIVHIVDLFDFSSTFLSAIKRQTGQADVILVGNKYDLLPKSVKPNKVIKWIRHMANLEDFKALDVVLTSGKKMEHLDGLMDAIIKNYHKRKIYFVGCSNVGKSTLLNAIIKRYTNEVKDIITTSKIPGTTLDMIEIKLDRMIFVDTPGIFVSNQIIHQLSSDAYDSLMPSKEIKPLVYQLNPGQTMFMSGLAMMDFVSGDKTSFVFYFSEKLNIHRTKTINKDELFSRQVGELLSPPSLNDFERLKYYDQDFVLDDTHKWDIVISGLGFISVKGNIKIRIRTIKGVTVYIREAII